MVPGDGKLELTFTPKDGGEPMKFNVFDFKGTGGVALAMYNTDKVRNCNQTHTRTILSKILSCEIRTF